MSLIIPTIGIDSGLVWEQSVNTNTTILDSHNHSPGNGIPIDSPGINLTTDLFFNNINAVKVRTIRFQSQLAPLSTLTPSVDLGCIYVTGNDLWYNDENGVQIQITKGGLVFASSSNISAPPTSTAGFSSGVLQVLQAPTTPASIQAGNILIGNTGILGSKYVTLQPIASLGVNYSLTLPIAPVSGTQLLQIDTFGVITATITFSSQIANNIGLAMTSTGADHIGTNMTNTGADGVMTAADSTGANTLVGKTTSTVLISGKHPAVVNSGTQRIAIVRGSISSSGTILSGQGFTVSHTTTGAYTITFDITFSDLPTVAGSIKSAGFASIFINFSSPNNSSINSLTTFNFAPIDSDFDFIAMGTPI